MIVPIYCPKCKEKGRKKLLMKADSNTRGIVYPWCKVCHDNVRIDLVPESRTD